MDNQNKTENMFKITQNRKVLLMAVSIFVVSVSMILFFVGGNGQDLSVSNENLQTQLLEVFHHNEEKVDDYRELLGDPDSPLFVVESDGTFSYLSPDFAEKIGYSEEELLGEAFFPYIHSKDLPVFVTAFTKLVQNGEQQSNLGPFRIEMKNGN